MNVFQENLFSWLSRPAPDRSINQCFGMPLVLSTDIGLLRKENQDRVAAISIGTKSDKAYPLIAVAVADGMGGMRNGSECAKLAISSFFYSLIRHRGMPIKERADVSIKYANEQVFQYSNGYGGSTLSAILIDSTKNPLVVHVGDSRVYSYETNKKIKRHTTDDSLAEAVGGSGRELLQFVGMGEALQGHLVPVNTENSLFAITTDGIHYLEDKTLEAVLINSSDIKQASERLIALARWCGGFDNATSAILDINAISTNILNIPNDGIRIWDPHGELSILWSKEEEHSIPNKNFPHNNINLQEHKLDEKQPKKDTPSKDTKKPTKKPRKNKSNAEDLEKIQLDIDIEIGNSKKEDNQNENNSKSI